LPNSGDILFRTSKFIPSDKKKNPLSAGSAVSLWMLLASASHAGLPD
jgi:hypothetical protein